MAEQKKESELAKARGETESQKSLKAYHEGDFQTTDPVTGEKRNPGGFWQDADNLPQPIGEELSPEDMKAAQKAEVARSADAGAPPARKPAAKKAAKKRGR